MSKTKSGIRRQIMLIFLSTMAFVFVAVLISFNLLLDSYIRKNAESQLSEALSLPREENHSSDRLFLPDTDRIPPSRIGTQADVFMIDGNYNVISIQQNENLDGSGLDDYSSERKNLASVMKHKNVDLTSPDIVRISYSEGQYYLTVAQRGENLSNTGPYMVFYVDVTSISNLAVSVNIFLITILIIVCAAAMAVLFLFSSRISQPIKELSEFSLRLGKNNFTRDHKSYSVRELDELSCSMNTAAEKLEIYDKDQKTFFQNASHELRTPLMSIKCYAEGIKYGIMDPAQASDTIIEDTDRMSILVEDLLYISKIDSSGAKTELSENDLRELISACADMHKNIINSKNINIVYDFADFPVLLNCSGKNMMRALSNLISNACKYAKSRILLRCRESEKEIIMSVIDDGCGVKEEDAPHIFERFYKKNSTGHGIGLSIVKAVAEQQGGRISVQNTSEGTNFSIIFDKR